MADGRSAAYKNNPAALLSCRRHTLSPSEPQALRTIGSPRRRTTAHPSYCDPLPTRSCRLLVNRFQSLEGFFYGINAAVGYTIGNTRQRQKRRIINRRHEAPPCCAFLPRKRGHPMEMWFRGIAGRGCYLQYRPVLEVFVLIRLACFIESPAIFHLYLRKVYRVVNVNMHGSGCRQPPSPLRRAILAQIGTSHDLFNVQKI